MMTMKNVSVRNFSSLTCILDLAEPFRFFCLSPYDFETKFLFASRSIGGIQRARIVDFVVYIRSSGIHFLSLSFVRVWTSFCGDVFCLLSFFSYLQKQQAREHSRWSLRVDIVLVCGNYFECTTNKWERN